MTISSVKTGDDGYDANVTNTAWYQNAGSGRGVFVGGHSATNTIDYVTIASAGNATDFGDSLYTRGFAGGTGSSTRGIVFGGQAGVTGDDKIEYITIASLGNGTAFGSLSERRQTIGACGNETRAIAGGGSYDGGVTPQRNIIEYVTISTTGNVTDFGDLTVARKAPASCSSTTRGIWAGGTHPSGSNEIDYVTIATLGNATDFGDLTMNQWLAGAVSSSTRGVIGGGDTAPQETIAYVTIASAGNATDFGDLTVGRSYVAGVSNSTRGAFGGNGNTIDYVTIATAGNATDFGDLTVSRYAAAGVSNAHGGIATDALQFINSASPQTEHTQGLGVFGQGWTGSANSNTIDYVDIQFLGNAVDWGDLTAAGSDGGAGGGRTRGLIGGGYGMGTVVNYIEFSAKGNGTSFGTLTARSGTGEGPRATANSVMCLFAGGLSNSNVIDYFTIASIGNATDFGDLTVGRTNPASFASATRAVFAGNGNVIDYVTIATTGNATDFGDTAVGGNGVSEGSGCGSDTRGMYSIGNNPAGSGTVNTVEYVTIASTGNATDFGDLTVARNGTGSASSKTRALWAAASGGNVGNTIDYFTIATTGNATDFGDLTRSHVDVQGMSNSHGGL